jgi:hypothetical protein
MSQEIVRVIIATGPTLAEFAALKARVAALEVLVGEGGGSGSISGSIVAGGDAKPYWQMDHSGTDVWFVASTDVGESGGASGSVVTGSDGKPYLKLVVSGTAYYLTLLTSGVTESGGANGTVVTAGDGLPYLKIISGGNTYYSSGNTTIP